MSRICFPLRRSCSIISSSSVSGAAVRDVPDGRGRFLDPAASLCPLLGGQLLPHPLPSVAHALLPLGILFPSHGIGPKPGIVLFSIGLVLGIQQERPRLLDVVKASGQVIRASFSDRSAFCLSGWSFRANLRYALVISDSVAPSFRPSTSYGLPHSGPPPFPAAAEVGGWHVVSG